MAEQLEYQKLPGGFQPASRGRKPIVEAEPYVKAIRQAQGQWVVFEITENRKANSLLRQLNKSAGIQCSSQRRADGGKDVYARYNPAGTL